MWPEMRYMPRSNFWRDLKRQTYAFQCKMAGKHRRKHK